MRTQEEIETRIKELIDIQTDELDTEIINKERLARIDAGIRTLNWVLEED